MDTIPTSPPKPVEMEKWTDKNSKTYVLESVPDLFQSDSDDDYLYEEIPIEEFEDDKSDTEDENLEKTVRNITERKFFEETETEIKNMEENKDNVANTSKPSEVVEDYIRNFFYSRGLKKSLETFQEEWYEFKKKGNLSPEDSVIVPDIYAKNQKLTDNIQKLRTNIEEYKEIANKAQSTFEKLKKERDFHKMHHQRVVQEKNKLVTDINRLKNKCSMYEPMIEGIQKKYETAMKEKMLTKLDRDRLAGKIISLETTISQLENLLKENEDKRKHNGRISHSNPGSRYMLTEDEEGEGEGMSNVPASTNGHGGHGATGNGGNGGNGGNTTKKGKYGGGGGGGSILRESIIPAGTRQNPYSHMDIQPVNAGKLSLAQNVKGHDAAISAIKLHPKKKILATVSDDKYWKMWAFPSGELIMSGMGHTDWIADCDFHPRGGQLATASGDSTLKIWDFLKGQAISTLADHTQAVWGCAYHDLGDFIVSGSMDHTAKPLTSYLHSINFLCSTILSYSHHFLLSFSPSFYPTLPYLILLYSFIHSFLPSFSSFREKCKHTFRGHSDSVNNVGFQPYSNLMYTCSSDKSITLWDIRSGMVVQTLYGHNNSINSGSFALKGNVFASCDADGVVKVWDVRSHAELASVNYGPSSANKVAFDPSGTVVAVAMDDGTCKLFNCNSRSTVKTLEGKEESVQTVLFDHNGEYLITAGSEGFYQIYK